MKSRMGAVLAGAIVALAAAFFVIAVSTNNWQTSNGGQDRLGLWNICLNGASDADCIKLDLTDCKFNDNGNIGDASDGNCAEFNGVRALCILAMIFGLLAAFALLILTAFCSMQWGRFHGLWCGTVSGLFGMACMAVEVDLNNKKEQLSATGFGYSFGLLTAGWLLMLGGTGYSGYASAGNEA